MSASYVPVSWNPFKKKYDLFLWIFIGVYLMSFILLNVFLFPQLILVTILIRAFGTLAIVLLHVILVIGPLCRLDTKFLPLLYNRRHLGVTMFFMASAHAILSLIWFHSSGVVPPLISLFYGNTHYDSLRFFPFQTLGFVAYLILMVMAITSHDFWLHLLSPKLWKGMHMMVYVAYSFLIMHVVLGIIQLESNPLMFSILFSGLILICTLHLFSGFKEWKMDNISNLIDQEAWSYVCDLDDIVENRAKIVTLKNERVAIFKYENKLSAVHNVCKHQNGPLGEGEIIDGCITCPWHGYQYRPQDGCAPPPFTEKLATYALKLENESIFIQSSAFPEGTAIEPLYFSKKKATHTSSFFIGWREVNPMPVLKFATRSALAIFTIVLLGSMVFVSKFKHNAHSSFDYTQLKEIQGQLISFPFPAIRSLSTLSGKPVITTYPLVNDAKFGADGLVDSMKERYNIYTYTTMIQGGLIKRGNASALELTNGRLSLKVTNKNNGLLPGKLEKISDTTLEGEIIDPKCYLGAMNPGEGKPHRSCAILCIRGGIMPMIIFQGTDQSRQYAIILGSKGEKINKHVIPFVAEPVKMKGTLYRFDNWYVFYTDPKTIVPLFN